MPRIARACHGAAGDAKTPLAATLDPPPIAFADRERARERSLFALYQVIDQGLEGTAMASFGHLPEDGQMGARLHRRTLRLSRRAGRAGTADLGGDAAVRRAGAGLGGADRAERSRRSPQRIGAGQGAGGDRLSEERSLRHRTARRRLPRRRPRAPPPEPRRLRSGRPRRRATELALVRLSRRLRAGRADARRPRRRR